MAALLPDVAKQGCLLALMRFFSGEPNCTAHLFSNNFTPSASTTLASFVESSFPGYAPIALPTAVDLGVNSSGIDVYLYPQISFVASAGPTVPVPVYGYWIQWLDVVASVLHLCWCELFPSPIAIISVGDGVKFALSMGLTQGP